MMKRSFERMTVYTQEVVVVQLCVADTLVNTCKICLMYTLISFCL